MNSDALSKESQGNPIKSYTELFNKKRGGINYSLGQAFLIASLLSYFLMFIIGILYRANVHVHMPPPSEWLIVFVSDFLKAGMLLFLSYLISKDWLLAAIWGLAAIVVEYLVILRGSFHPEWFLISYLGEFIFVFGLIIMVRLSDLRPTLFILGMTVVVCLKYMDHTLYAMTKAAFSPEIDYSFRLTPILLGIITGIVFSIFLHMGLCLQATHRKFHRVLVGCFVFLLCGSLLTLSVILS